MTTRIGGIAGIILLLTILYLIAWPVPIKPIAFQPPEMPLMTGVYEPNKALRHIELIAEGHCITPEDIAFDQEGRLYSSMNQEGIIMRFHTDGTHPEVFAKTGWSYFRCKREFDCC